MILGETVSTCFTDREYGTRPQTIDVIDERLWADLYSLIQTGIENGSFGLRFPEQCSDGNGPCGCEPRRVFRRLRLLSRMEHDQQDDEQVFS
jgi:hypothetical protein